MPRKGKRAEGRKGSKFSSPAVKRAQCEEEDDAVSVMSDVTCSTLNSDGEEEEISESEKFEGKVKLAIDLAQEKSLNLRIKGLQDLKTILQSRVAECDELGNLYATICDAVERSVKRGSSNAERIAAAKLGSVLMLVTLNLTAAITDEVYNLLQPTFLIVCQDPTVSAPVREEVCRTVAILACFGSVEYTQLQDSINTLHSVFAKALPKGNGELPNLQPASLLMHSAALQGFNLLLTLAKRSDVVSQAPVLLNEMMSVLSTRELDMRAEAGIGVALLYELVRDSEQHFRFPREKELVERIDELATDCEKHRGKKERKQQRAVFRAVQSTVLDDDFTPEVVGFGYKKIKDVLHLDCWELKCRYDVVCHALEQGLNVHFVYNDGLRSNFHMPELDLVMEADSKEARNNRRRYAGYVNKQRDMIRNRNRDNRALATTYED